MVYYIHIFYHLKDEFSDVCVSIKKYNREWEKWEYDWYSGEYEQKSIPVIQKYDKKLLKYLEILEE